MKWLYYRFLYRPLMRLAHRYNWHHAPANRALTNAAGWPLHWCQWCGMRDFVMPKMSMRDEMGARVIASEHKLLQRNNP